ncbi:MAG: serine/threonine-protein kinase [Candidatus Obscuribacterales bacterium]|nr:serine/threonine-protein kinase [Candidatus Obscuribacterales bacterium]
MNQLGDTSALELPAEWTAAEHGLTIVEPVASTLQSVVYKARQELLGRVVALKVRVGTDRIDLLRFQQEAKILQVLDHPGIGKVFGCGQLGDNAYILMEWLEGKSLEQLMSEGPVRFDLVSTIVRDITAALSHAHGKGIVHRDIKPSNIFIEEKDGKFLARLIDFGIARPLESSQSYTATGTLLGSPAYMSPEQCTKSVIDERSDIYSLGCVLYQLLSGEYVFRGSTAADMMYRHVNESPLPLKPNSSAAKVVMKCLAKSPDQRYQTASQLQQAWMDIDDMPPSAVEPLRAGARSKVLLYAAIVALLIVFGWWLRPSETFQVAEDFQKEIKKIETANPEDTIRICRSLEQRTLMSSERFKVLKVHLNASKTLKNAEESIDIARRLGALSERVSVHPDVTIALDHSANVLRDNGLYQEAEKFYQRAIQKREAYGSGYEKFDVACYKIDYAQLLSRIGKFKREECLLREALKLLVEEHPYSTHPEAVARCRLAKNALVRQKPDEAAELRAKASALLAPESVKNWSEFELVSFRAMLKELDQLIQKSSVH